MKNKILLSLIAVMMTIAVKAQEVPQLANVLSRETMSLNGAWHYIVDVQEEGYYDYRMNPTQWGFFRNAKPQKPEDLIEYDFDKAATMQIPGDWNTQDERLFFYEGTVWFKTSFRAQVPIENCRTLLYFGAVNYDCRVWVNGRAAGHHIGGFTPFNFDVTDMLKNGENTVIVKVDNKRKAEAIPTQIFDWWNYGGITRDVLVVKVPGTYIENYKLELQKADVNAKQREITMTAHLNKPEAGQTLTLTIPELKVKQQCVTDAEGNASLTLRIPSKRLSLWSPDNPKRYSVTLASDHDVVADSIGFRTIETRGKQLLLNGKPIFLRGISIHEEKPFEPTVRLMPTPCSHGLRNWVATSCASLTIPTMSTLSERPSVWAYSYGARFHATGLSPGPIPTHTRTPKGS